MTKIIPLRYSDMEKVRKMIEYVSPNISKDRVNGETFVHSPFAVLHGLLPINLKFLQECYVAVEGEELLGLISLAPDGNQKTRWKINRLILNPNAYDAGKQLIDYVVNKYGGAGVETFVTTIDENYTEAIALFKTACSFRSCSKITIWEYENLKNIETSKNKLSLRAAELSDAKNLYKLDCEALYPKFKTALIKTEKDFKFGMENKFINKLKGHKIQRFVLDNPQKDSIESFLSVMTGDNINFWVDITLSLAYQEYYEDVLNFAINHVYSINQDGKFYIGVRDFQQTCKKMTDVLSQHDFRQCGDFEVLVKDYWRPAEYTTEKKVPIMIFPDMTSPACNIVKFIKEF
jgi:hypothetical protein